MDSSRKWFKVITSRIELDLVSQNKSPNRWKFWKPFNIINRKFIRAQREAAKRKSLSVKGTNVALRQERAAICIQTAFRVFLARKVLRALKGLLHLQAAITGHNTPKQSSVSLYCIHAFIRVQARIHRQPAGKFEDALELGQKEAVGLVNEKGTVDPEIDWCNALGTVEEIQAKEQQRQLAAIKRDRAIAYAFSNKWKSKTKITPGSFFDGNLDNSSWTWIWLDDWLNEQPKKSTIVHTAIKQQNDGAEKQRIQKSTATSKIHNCKYSKVSADKTKDRKVVNALIRSPGRSRFARSLSGGKGRKAILLSPKRSLQSKKSSGNSKKQPSINRKWKASLTKHD